MEHRGSREPTGLAAAIRPRISLRSPLRGVERSSPVRDRSVTHLRNPLVHRHLPKRHRAEVQQLPLAELPVRRRRVECRQSPRKIWEGECPHRLALMLLRPVPAARRLFRLFQSRISSRRVLNSNNLDNVSTATLTRGRFLCEEPLEVLAQWTGIDSSRLDSLSTKSTS